MKLSERFPRVIFPDDFGEKEFFEMTYKGYANVDVELENGCCYKVYFSDPVRLQQDLEEDSALGRPFIAQPGLVILKEVTVDLIESSVKFLFEEGFFDSFQCIKPVL